MSARKNLDVRRVGSSLIATFGKANPPLIWRFDIERNHSFTLGLQGDDHEWELGVTSPKGEFYSVARFPQREDAEEAFARLSQILAKGRGDWIRGLLKVVALIAVGFGLLAMLVWAVQSFAPATPVMQPNVAAAPPPVQPTPPPAPQGVPLPADEVLKPPSP